MIDDLKPYPAYKDSGVEWLGQVPEHWEVAPIRAFARPGYKTFTDGDWIESPYIRDEGIRLIQTGNIGIGSYREQGFRYIDEETFKQFRCTEIQPRDILICRLAEPVGRACLAPDLGVRMITSVDVCILKPRSDVDPAFVVYALSYQGYLSWMNSICRGGTRDRVSRSMLGSIRIQKPPFDEQTAIVRFLDYMDRRIRRYIRAKQKLIKLLEEYKQALIHQAVTGQIDVRTGQPYPAYKPSGVEWLGQVPEHWEVLRLKYVARLRSGESITSERIEETGDYPVYGGNGIRGFTSSFTHEGEFVLIGRQGALCGNINYANGKFWASEHAVVVHPMRKCLNHLLGELFQAMNLNQYSIAAAQPGLAVERIQNLVIPFPPIDEQEQIDQYIKNQVNAFDAAIAATRSEIELLREYRTRLIADVVTGKVDVREVAARLPEEPSEEDTLWTDEEERAQDETLNGEGDHAAISEEDG